MNTDPTLQSALLEDEDTSCNVCHQTGDEHIMLLCGDGECSGCGKGSHTYCIEPQMMTVPEGDWFCTDCTCTGGKEGVERGGAGSSTCLSCGLSLVFHLFICLCRLIVS